MTRIPQEPATRGSQYWLQHLVAENQFRLDNAIGLGTLEWLSPIASDDYAEYRDQDFLDRLGVEPKKNPLDVFWPAGGPVWDGLARTGYGAVVLVEAKSHITEMNSTCGATAEEGVAMISSAFAHVQKAFDVEPGHDWSANHYQYANRLAHAWWLNEVNGIPAELAFLYFIGDSEMGGPETREEWRRAVLDVHDCLGVLGQLPRYVHDVFVPVGDQG